MSSALSLSLFGLLLCVALSLANPLGNVEELSEVSEVTEDTEGLQTLDEMISGDFVKQQTDIDEINTDHGESMANELEEHKVDLDGVLGDVDELSKEEAVEEDPSEVGHEVVKRDVENEEEEGNEEVAEEEEHIEKEIENEEEHDEQEEDNEGLLTWYREAIDKNST